MPVPPEFPASSATTASSQSKRQSLSGSSAGIGSGSARATLSRVQADLVSDSIDEHVGPLEREIRAEGGAWQIKSADVPGLGSPVCSARISRSTPLHWVAISSADENRCAGSAFVARTSSR